MWRRQLRLHLLWRLQRLFLDLCLLCRLLQLCGWVSLHIRLPLRRVLRLPLVTLQLWLVLLH